VERARASSSANLPTMVRPSPIVPPPAQLLTRSHVQSSSRTLVVRPSNARGKDNTRT
jgi:hypothetical protein